MAIFNDPDKEEEEKDDAYKPVDKPDYDSATVNHRYTKLSSLITHLEGYSWSVSYYQQILGEDDQPKPPSFDTDETLQQYQKVNNFELKVNQTLDYRKHSDYDEDVLTGEASVYPGTVLPQHGDAFIADIGDGRMGIFVVDTVEPMSIMLERAYRIDYHLQVQLTKDRLEDLESKVIKTYYFRKDFLQGGRNPLLREEEIVEQDTLYALREDLLYSYGSSFIDPEYRHLLIPEQETSTYDYFLSRFLCTIVETSQMRYFRSANWPDAPLLRDQRIRTVLDALLSPSYAKHLFNADELERKVGFKSLDGLHVLTPMGSLYHTRIKRLSWPALENQSVELGYDRADQDKDYFENTIPDSDEEVDTDQRAEIYPVDIDDNYIFSEAFYARERTRMSMLEYMVDLYLNYEPLPVHRLIELCESSFNWAKLERFYYTPILVLLIDYVRYRS